jgi:AcrR family transcriptional regulator
MVRQSADQRRESVLRAAMHEFSLAGYAGTSTEAIARTAGISQPYLFRLFATKKDLFVATLEVCFARIEEAFEAAADGQIGENALCGMGESYLDFLADRDLLLTELHVYAASNDPDVRAAAQHAFGHLWETVQRLSGLPPERVKEFFAMGMLLNVAAALDLARLDDKWAQLCVSPDGQQRRCTHTHHTDDPKIDGLLRVSAAHSLA